MRYCLPLSSITYGDHVGLSIIMAFPHVISCTFYPSSPQMTEAHSLPQSMQPFSVICNLSFPPLVLGLQLLGVLIYATGEHNSDHSAYLCQMIVGDDMIASQEDSYSRRMYDVIRGSNGQDDIFDKSLKTNGMNLPPPPRR